MHAFTTGMETTRTVLLVLGLLCLTCLASGLSKTEADQSGTFSVEDYSDWLQNHTINVVNYVAEVGTDVAILSPISPPPIGMRWFSLNFDGELRPSVGREVGRVGSTNSEKFPETYNTSWQSVFTFDKLNRWLRIRRVQLGYSDLFRVFVGENGTGESAGKGSEKSQAFDVAITLMTFEKHECGFTSKPQNPKAGDMLILSCSVIVNGMWNASLIFRNNYDKSEIIGETKTCGIQRSLGSKICSSVRVKAETVILAYSCRLEFPSNGRHVPNKPMFLSSKWTAVFNKEVVCNLPKIYLEGLSESEADRSDGDKGATVGRDPRTFTSRPVTDASVIRSSTSFRTLEHEEGDAMDTAFGGVEAAADVGPGFTEQLATVGQIEILCNHWPCLDGGIMKVGDIISLYFEWRGAGGMGWSVNLPGGQHQGRAPLGLWYYTLGVNDLGKKLIKFQITVDNRDRSMERTIYVTDALTGIDMLCNGKVCQDNEIMRFGDEISCYFKPKFMIDGMTFTLLIDNYVKVEGYPCMYELREEDVGSKLVECNSSGNAGTFQATRNITVICEFRDEVVLKPVKKDYDDTPYELKFRKDNVTYYSGAILLCGDEPCDEPGRTIYNGTYVICRLNDGKMTSLILTINGSWINWQMPVTVSELSYKLKRTGKTQATCQGISHAFNSTKNISFIVHEWPCPASVKAASADIFEHGDAAGAIDVDQAENTDPGPAASNKDARKGNDGMAAEKSGTAGDDKSKPNIGSGPECFVLLQLFFAFIAAFVGFVQF